jgi:hypothetical protein
MPPPTFFAAFFTLLTMPASAGGANTAEPAKVSGVAIANARAIANSFDLNTDFMT